MDIVNSIVDDNSLIETDKEDTFLSLFLPFSVLTNNNKPEGSCHLNVSDLTDDK